MIKQLVAFAKSEREKKIIVSISNFYDNGMRWLFSLIIFNTIAAIIPLSFLIWVGFNVFFWYKYSKAQKAFSFELNKALGSLYGKVEDAEEDSSNSSNSNEEDTIEL